MLTAHGAPCLHEGAIAYGHQPTFTEIFNDDYMGICDPGAIPVYGREAIRSQFVGQPTALIVRDSKESKHAFEKWLGNPLPETGWIRLQNDLAWFEQTMDPMVISFRQLDDPVFVGLLIKHLTGFELNHAIFNVFDTLRIEQHREKASMRLTKDPSWR